MSIAGTWFNELGSQLDIVLSGATITGTYWTAVGSASGQYDLIGFIDTTTPSPGGQALGWTVVWNNVAAGTSNSVTTWSGQYQTDGGQEEIVTFWLLTSEQVSADDWAATLVGQNTFSRTRPTPERIKQARRHQAVSHPRKLK